MELNISEGAKRIIKKLNNAGFEAYVTGSTLRNLIMKRQAVNYNIVSSALPEQIKKLFNYTIDSGKSNFITVVDNKIGYKISSFICEQNEEGEFTFGPQTEAKNKDFTINSILYNNEKGIIDYYNGIEDIENKIIRCTETAEQKFRQRPILMLRAIRYKAQLGFEIDEATEKSIVKSAILIKKAKSEEKLIEINKILLSEHPDYIRDLHRMGLLKYIMPELEKCFGEPQKNKFHIYDVGEHIMHTVENTPPDLTLRWAALMHDTGKPCCSSTDQNGIIHFYGHHRESRRITVDLLHRLQMNVEMIKDISILVENHDYRVDSNFIAVKRMMTKTGAELFEKLLILQSADNRAKNPKHYPEKLKKINNVSEIYREVLATHQPYRIMDLLINSRDLINIGYHRGKEIGDTLRILLDEIIINPELNNYSYLIKRARELRKKNK